MTFRYADCTAPWVPKFVLKPAMELHALTQIAEAISVLESVSFFIVDYQVLGTRYYHPGQLPIKIGCR